MADNPNKEMWSFFAEAFGTSGVLVAILLIIILKLLEIFGVIEITLWGLR